MNTCPNCRKKFDSMYGLDDCDRCGAGLVETEDEDFIDWMMEPGTDNQQA